MNRRRAKRHFGIIFIGLFCLCVHPTMANICMIRSFDGKLAAFLGKIIISIGCLHSFQGLFYIVVTLEGYSVATGSAVGILWEICAIRKYSTIF